MNPAALFCVDCGRAVGWSPRLGWLHLDGRACLMSPWLNHGDHDRATPADLAAAAADHALELLPEAIF